MRVGGPEGGFSKGQQTEVRMNFYAKREFRNRRNGVQGLWRGRQSFISALTVSKLLCPA